MPKLIDILRDAAPAIGTAMTVFGGAPGAAAAALLGSVLNLPKEADEATMVKALQNATPEQMAALQKADNDFKVQMAQIDLQRYNAAISDIANARQREISTGDKQPMRLAWTIIGGFIAVVVCIMYFVFTGQAVSLKDPTIAGTVGTVLGYLAGIANQVVSYYFGSSTDSKQKTAIMNDWFKTTP